MNSFISKKHQLTSIFLDKKYRPDFSGRYLFYLLIVFPLPVSSSY
ncbi:hypothetical protein [Listeria monocytogenes]|nr:hypothetical protein [Listeria monocytogenes]